MSERIGVERDREAEQLWDAFRQARSSYQTICRVLVERGILAEMPTDLDKPIKV